MRSMTRSCASMTRGLSERGARARGPSRKAFPGARALAKAHDEREARDGRVSTRNAREAREGHAQHDPVMRKHEQGVKRARSASKGAQPPSKKKSRPVTSDRPRGGWMEKRSERKSYRAGSAHAQIAQ